MAFENLTKLWANKVRDGVVTIDEVPGFLQEKVSAYIESLEGGGLIE